MKDTNNYKKANKVDNKKENIADLNYAFYSKLLKEPFDSVDALRAAEDDYYAKLRAKEEEAAAKKADAKKVEAAYKALNAARKTYKEELTQLTKEYAESLENLKKAFELGKKDIHDTLAAAEDAYEKALRDFTAKHPEGYHITLKDGDFETTISTGSKVSSTSDILNIFDWLFKI